MQKIRWTDSRRREARRLYESGMSLAEVGAQLGTNSARASDAIKQAGGTIRPLAIPRRLPANTAEVFFDLYESGLTHRDIARQYDTHPSYVAAILRRSTRWTPLGRRAWTPERRTLAVELYRSGMTLQAVAAAMKSNNSRVRAVLLAARIRLRKQDRYGDKNPCWRGGRRMMKGYVEIRMPDHPNARGGYMLEHRVVMERMIGRLLRPEEVVHHKNAIRSDNRPENLQLYSSNGEHLADELAGRCPNWSEDGKRRLREAARKPRGPQRNRRRSRTDGQA